MRRKDREVTDFNKICEFIKESDTVRLGFVDNGEAYIVPLNFGYEIKDEKIIFYIHSAREGRKIDLFKKDANVTFELDCGHELLSDKDKPCAYSYKYKCVMGRAKATILTDLTEKSYGMNKMMEHYTGKSDFKFPSIMMNVVTVIRIEVTSMTAKEHL